MFLPIARDVSGRYTGDTMATITASRQRTTASPLRVRVLEEARDAVAKLRTLQPLLSPQDAETLAILIDQDLMRHLDKSLRETAAGKTKPLAHILK